LSAGTLSSFAQDEFGIVPVADVCLEDGETKAVLLLTLSSSLRRDAAKIANKVGRVLRPADVNCTEYTPGNLLKYTIVSRSYIFLNDGLCYSYKTYGIMLYNSAVKLSSNNHSGWKLYQSIDWNPLNNILNCFLTNFVRWFVVN